MKTLEFAKLQLETNRGKPREEMWREIVEALEYRTEKKPTVRYSHWKKLKVIGCPTCNHALGTYLQDDNLGKELVYKNLPVAHPYCPNCGQNMNYEVEGREEDGRH